MEDHKQQISEFVLAEKIYDLLRTSGSSKRTQKEALGLVAQKYGLREVPMGLPLAPARELTVAPMERKPKASKRQTKSAVNSDPEVRKGQEILNSLKGKIRAFKARNEPPPEGLLLEKDMALRALKAARQLYRDRL
jgi:hypothetical protein